MNTSNKILNISSSCKLNYYGQPGNPYPVSLEYVEYSQDYWHPNTETSIDIDIKMAKQIVSFLEKSFKQKLSTYGQLPSPQEIAECGGPCEEYGAQACDCR
jgi:hypothetical protein